MDRGGAGTVYIGGGIFETTGSVVEEVILKTSQGLEGNGILSSDVLTACII